MRSPRQVNLRCRLFLAAASLAAGFLLPRTALSQSDSARWRVYLTATDAVTGKSSRASFGFHPQATFGVDDFRMSGFTDHWTELDTDTLHEYPSPPVGFFQELRINNYRGGPSPPNNGFIFGNIHPYTGPSTVDTFIVTWNGDSEGDSTFLYQHPQILSWPSVLRFYADSITLRDIRRNNTNLIGDSVRIDMTKDSSWTYVGDRYLNPDIGQYSVDPFNKGFVMIVKNPKPGPGPPAPVTQLLPSPGSTGVPLSGSLTWSAVPGAFWYKVQLDTSRKFAHPLVVDSGLATSKAVAGLLQSRWYYWRVIVSNSYGVSYYQTPPDSFMTLASTPAAPPIVSPTPGQTGVSPSAPFKWRAGVPPLTYEVQLSLFPGYAPLLQDTTLSDTSLTFPSPLLNCLTYYWRVRGTNANGPGAFSSASFTVSVASPAVPVIVQYPDGQTNVPANARLIWTGRDACTAGYRVEVSTDSGFVQLTLNTTVADTTLPLSNLLGLTTYYWRVRAENPAGGVSSAYTATRSFTTAQLPPSVPVTVSPQAGGTASTLSPTLVWRTPLNNPASYRLQLDVNANFASPIVDDSTLTDTSRAVGPLTGCTKYYWRVSAKNGIGSSAFSTAIFFNAPLQPPSPPALVSPPDAALDQPTQVLLTWLQTGVCAPALYVTELATDSAFGAIIRRDTAVQTSKSVGPLGTNVRYFWRVRAVNDSGFALSAERSFTTTSVTKPPIPVLLAPPNGQGGLSVTPLLSWDSTARTNRWHLQVGYDVKFAQIAFEDSTLTGTSRQVGPLLNSTTYFWRVSAKNDSGSSAYSEVRSFTTLFPPSAPGIVQPGDGSVDVPVTPTFVWGQPSGAQSYQLQVSRDLFFTNFFSNDSDLASTSWVLGRALTSYTRYYWRVRAKNSVGWGPFSGTVSFRTTRVGAANWAIPLAIGETGPGRDTAYFGISPQASVGIDPSLGEFELPPMTNDGLIDLRFVDVHSPSAIGEGLRIEYLPFTTYNQVDTFKVRFQPGTGSYPMRFSWPAGYIRTICDSLVLTDEFGGVVIHKRMDVDSSLTVSNPSIATFLLVLYGAFPITDVKPVVPALPHGFAISQNYPNPFNPSTRIQFSTEHSARITIVVYDVLGRQVATLADADFFPGIYSASWFGTGEGGTHLPSGIYYARMTAARVGEGVNDAQRFVRTVKMVMLK